MVRVLYVSAAGERGGLEVVLLSILKAVDRSRFTPNVALLEGGPLVGEVRDTDTETWVIEAGRVRNVMRAADAIAHLVRLIKRERIAVVHTMNAKAHLYGGCAAALCGAPCVYHLHGVPRPSPSRDGIVSLLSVIVPAARTIACSRFVADTFRQAWRSRRQVTVVHNGLSPWLRERETRSVREELGIADAEPLVVMIARLQRWKGVHVFVDAAAEVARLCEDARFLVVGGSLFGLERDYPAELRARAERLGLFKALRFVGHQPSTARFFADADVVVHASVEPEPFGMVVLEAMAAGKPVVATDLGGPREIVLDGETGYLIPPNRADLLAESIVTLVQNPELRARMGQVGQIRFTATFVAERMCRELERIYEGLTSRPRGSASGRSGLAP